MTTPADAKSQSQQLIQTAGHLSGSKRPQVSDDPTHSETLYSGPPSESLSFNNDGSGHQLNSLGGLQNSNLGRGHQFPGSIFHGPVNFGPDAHEDPAQKNDKLKIPNRHKESKSSWPIKRRHAAIIFLVICIAVGVGVGVSSSTKPHSAEAANQATTSTAPTPSTTSSTTSSTQSAQIDQAGCPGTHRKNVTANDVTFTIYCYTNCNFNANDVSNFKADSLSSCAGNCTEYPECQGAVYVMDLNDPSTCWLKSQTDKRTPDAGRICMIRV